MADKTPYKIIFRKDNSENPASLWQTSCPLLLEAVQIFRDTASSQAFLQIKVKNISSEAVERFTFLAKVAFEDGDFQAVQEQIIDADILPGAERAFGAYPLENPLAVSAEAVVSSLVLASGESWTFNKPLEIPKTKELHLSEEALEERNKQLSEKSFSYKTHSHAVIKDENWWICPCGAPNVDKDACHSCGIEKNFAEALENETELLERAKERKEKEAALEKERKEKAEEKAKRLSALKKKARIGAAACVAAASVVGIAFAMYSKQFEENLAEGAYVLTEIDDLSDYDLYTYKLNDRGDTILEKVEIAYDEADLDYSWLSDWDLYTNRYSIDDSGMIIESNYDSTSHKDDFTRVVKKTDSVGRPTKVEEESWDVFVGHRNAVYSIKYHGAEGIKEVREVTTWEDSDKSVSVTKYDKSGRLKSETRKYSDGDIISYRYEYVENSKGQVTSITRSYTNTTNSYEEEETFYAEYDKNGNLIELQDEDDCPVCRFSYKWVETPSPCSYTRSKFLLPSIDLLDTPNYL